MPPEADELPGGDHPKTWSLLIEVFHAPEGEEDERPVVLFQHLDKTGGSAMRELIRANMSRGSRLAGRLRDQHWRPSSDVSRYYRDYYEGLTADARAALRCVMSHTANYLLPLIERPVEAVTLVREPVDRVVSLYYMWEPNRGKALEPAGVEVPPSYRSDPGRATLGDVYRRLGSKSPRDSQLAATYWPFFNGQSRSLLAPHYDTLELGYSEGPPPDAELWRERLFTIVSERYLVGLQERWDDFAAELVERHDWQRVETRGKVGRFRPSLEDVPVEASETIRAYNWLDDDLHHLCAELVDARRSKLTA